MRYESWAERQIREAMERGEFDNLPGAGKPLPDRDTSDPDWWVKGMLEREKLPMPLPPGLQLRKEIQQLPQTLAELRTEEQVRELVTELNARIHRQRRFPEGPVVHVPDVDLDEALATWRERGKPGPLRP